MDKVRTRSGPSQGLSTGCAFSCSMCLSLCLVLSLFLGYLNFPGFMVLLSIYGVIGVYLISSAILGYCVSIHPPTSSTLLCMTDYRDLHSPHVMHSFS